MAVFIGRFSPPHLGHLAVIKQALCVAEIVLIAIGSASVPRRHDYVPFTAAEREQMIRLMLTPEENLRVRFVHVPDQGNLPKWTGLIRKAANDIESNDSEITLIGHSKDNSSFYLKSFPNWASSNVENYMGLSATSFRRWFFSKYFDASLLSDFDTSFCTDAQKWKEAIHPEVTQWLIEFSRHNPAYQHLREEQEKCADDIEKYGRIDPDTGRKVYGPYVAADFVVMQGDFILAIERAAHPFKGCLALPGGFVQHDEDIVEAAIREGQREETGIKVPELVLRKSLITTQHFTAPFRDPRGRVYSFASFFYLNPVPPANMTDPKEIAKFLKLPRLKAGDDAAKAFWMPISEFTQERAAFDHYNIVQTMLEHLPRES